MADDYYAVLGHEFNADEGSFLLKLRCDLVWDKEAFTRLTEAMLACCKAYDTADRSPTLMGSAYDKTHLPRWLAEGFWYLSAFVRGHTAHPAWNDRIARDRDYYERAWEWLDSLASWFFTGSCPYLDPVKSFAPL